MKTYLIKWWHSNRSFLIFILLMCVFRNACADWNQVPTGSMLPTIQIGDRVLVNKLAYDVKLPFTAVSLYKIADPVRGDIIIFNSKTADTRLIKRVIGEPGDTIELRNNIVYINGRKLSYKNGSVTKKVQYQLENLLGIEHAVQLNTHGSSLSNMRSVTVPEAHYFVMGDNRNNSADSRVIGFVPRDEVIGKSETVVISLDYDNYYLPRSDRVFHPL